MLIGYVHNFQFEVAYLGRTQGRDQGLFYRTGVMIENGFMIEIGMMDAIDSVIGREVKGFTRKDAPCMILEMDIKEERHLDDLEGKIHHDNSKMSMIPNHF